MFTEELKVGGDGADPIALAAKIRADVIDEILSEVNGATRGLPRKRSDVDESPTE